MRTTLTLDPDVARKLQNAVAQEGSTLKAVVNEALRRGLEQRTTRKRPLFRVKARPMGLRPGIDPYKLNQLAADLETDDYLRKSRPR